MMEKAYLIMGLILLGLCAINQIGLSASVFHMVAHGLVTCGLFMIVGIVYLRFKDRNINTLREANEKSASDVEIIKKAPTYHAIILMKNNVGRVIE